MKLSELPQQVQDQLLAERVKLHETRKANDAWHIAFVNEDGTRYFEAYRKNDFTRFSGGCCCGWWNIRYGKVLWDRRKQLLGDDYDYFWVFSGKMFSKSQNGTEIPRSVRTKKEVLAIAKAIGIFNI